MKVHLIIRILLCILTGLVLANAILDIIYDNWSESFPFYLINILFVLVAVPFVFVVLRQGRSIKEYAERMHSLFDSLPNVIFFKDVNGRWLGGNRLAAELFNSQQEAGAALERSGLFKDHEAISGFLERNVRTDKEAWDTRSTVTFEEELVPLNGPSRFFEMRKIPLFHPDGKKKGLLTLSRDITEWKQVQEHLEEQNLRLRSIIDYNADGIFELDLNGVFINVNEVCLNLTGYRLEDFIGDTFHKLIVPEEIDKALQCFQLTSLGETQDYELGILHKQGHRIDILLKSVPIIVNGKMVGMYGIGKDITESKKLAQKLEEVQHYYRSLFDLSPDAIFVINNESKFISVNPAAEAMTGYTVQELEGSSFLSLIMEEQLETTIKQYENVITGSSVIFETVIRHKEGDPVCLHITAVPLILEGNTSGVIGLAKNITERKQSDEIIHFMAYHDVLTGLPNRRLFDEWVEQTMHHSSADCSQLALLFIDLDRFKVINDTLGHHIGDLMLQNIASRLKSLAGSGDMIARFGGDEFMMVVPSESREQIARLASRIIESLSKPFSLEGHELFVTPSIGISVYPDDGHTLEQLIKNADAAMYQVKLHGKNSFRFYDPEMNDTSNKRMKIENHLRKALERGELMLHYQPLMNISSGTLEGVEVLLRWRNEELGPVSPAEFIPVAEETGLIVPIGEWVLQTACLQMKQWHEAGLPLLRVSVNLSIYQCYQSSLVSTISRILQETGLEARYLDLEITETLTIESQTAADLLNRLKTLGVHISIDDFGTGYSSLNYLRTLPIDTLKIDQTFVRDIMQNTKASAIVSTIITMGHNLGLTVVAEGVETEEQLQMLKEHKCDIVQGYFFSQPLPAAEIEQWIADNNKSKQ